MIDFLRAKCHFYSGRFLSKAGNYIAACGQFERSLILSPKSVSPLTYLGWCQYQLHDYRDAIESFVRILARKSDHAYAHAMTGCALVYLGRDREAADALNRAIRIDPRFGEQWNMLRCLGIAYSHLDEDLQAFAALSRADQLKPNDPEVTYWLGRTLNSLERYEEAESKHRIAVRLEPDNYHAHAGLGMALYGLSNWAESIEEYQKAVHLEPTWVDGYIALGKAHREFKQYDRSIAALRQAETMQPKTQKSFSIWPSLLLTLRAGKNRSKQVGTSSNSARMMK